MHIKTKLGNDNGIVVQWNEKKKKKALSNVYLTWKKIKFNWNINLHWIKIKH